MNFGYIAAAVLITAPVLAAERDPFRAEDARSLLRAHCADCHNAEDRESGIRVDHLDGTFPDNRLKLWETIARQIESGSMPPEDVDPIPQEKRQNLLQWIDESLVAARSRPAPRNGSVRRLTVAQYRNTLRDLLGLQDDLTDVLPSDGVSKHGFTNQPESLSLSPLLLEAYLDIAQRAVNRCVVEPGPPSIQSFQMRFGDGINPEPIADKLILGANSHLLDNDDFVVDQIVPEKSFEFKPRDMRTRWRFNEGYQGNSTVRGWRDYDSIYHAVFACMRGSRGYPRGLPYTVVQEGLLLRPAIPNNGLFQIDSTYGPQANFKVSLRELPDHGHFRVTVSAGKYHDGLLVDETMDVVTPSDRTVVFDPDSQDPTVVLSSDGIYQVDAVVSEHDAKSGKKKKQTPTLRLELGNRVFTGAIDREAFLIVRLPAGSLTVKHRLAGSHRVDQIRLTPLDPSHPLATRFERFEQRSPLLGVHLGLRRDCGTTMSRVGEPQFVNEHQTREFVFEGAIRNFPSPDVQPGNDNYLAGLRDLGVRCEYTDGRERPRLLIQSIRFEGPYYETWPPQQHQNLFAESTTTGDEFTRAQRLIQSFATRAFRRPITTNELTSLMSVWRESWNANGDFRESIKDAFIVILTSPQFLFLIESSDTPDPEPLNEYELASKLAYFLWNSPPDSQSLQLAATGDLNRSRTSEVNRLINDTKFERFLDEYAAQWLSLDKFDVVETDRKAYPELTRAVKQELRKEPAHFLKHLIRNNLPARHLVQSDLLIANEVVAAYYGFGDRTESGFEFAPVDQDDPNLGGLLTQSAILAGLSDGRESNPVKRGAWLARKIIDQPPADPPPNVPSLEEDISGLSLRQRLELHRNQKGCANCHRGIDPWGLPFEEFDAGGRWKRDHKVDAYSTLPDQTEVDGMNDLKRYLAEDQIDSVAFSFTKHLTIYAIGRELTYNEIEQLRSECLELQGNGYPLRELVHLVVSSDPFLNK